MLFFKLYQQEEFDQKLSQQCTVKILIDGIIKDVFKEIRIKLEKIKRQELFQRRNLKERTLL